MLIRSQDRQELINPDNVEVINTGFSARDDSWHIAIGHPTLAENAFVIGRYETNEKALKVLDMIQEAYEGYILESSQPVGNGYYKQSFGYTPPRVFQMPQDEEVEA